MPSMALVSPNAGNIVLVKGVKSTAAFIRILTPALNFVVGWQRLFCAHPTLRRQG
jgi:hypothetical protein